MLLLGLCVFLGGGLLSLQAGDGRLMGPVGRSLAVGCYGLMGLTAYVALATLSVVAYRLLSRKTPLLALHLGIGLAIGALSIAVLAHLIAADYRVAGFGPGGLVGHKVAASFVGVVSTAGTALIAIIGIIVAVVIATPLSMQQVLRTMGGASKTVGTGALTGARRVGTDAAKFSAEVLRAVLPERDHDEYLDDLDEEDEELEDDTEELEAEAARVDPPIIEAGTLRNAVPIADLPGDTVPSATPPELSEESATVEPTEQKPKKRTGRKKKTMVGLGGAEQVPAAPDQSEAIEEAATEGISDKPTTRVATAEPVIVESRFKTADAREVEEKAKEVDGSRLDFIPLQDGEFQLPPVNLLDYDESRRASVDRAAMLELSARLTQTLESYGVKGEVAAIRPGPVVTMFEFAPARGTRLNRIVNLTDDLAMALEALKVRIVAPIPGKAAVGIEVPNRERETVFLKEIIADDTFQNSKLKLPMALGKSIEGEPKTVDLAKMPHLLVAGTTGSGKSVSVNSMITSLLYHCTPEQVRMIMVDPKMLELSIYEGVPHLLLPVITDPKKANIALRWAVDEMERRYGALAEMGVRDISGYNKKVEKLAARWEAERLERLAEEARRVAESGELDEVVEETEEREMHNGADRDPGPPRKLPFIVVIIDEFADLMMCAPKDVETSVARIAQKARAAGIHLILATQRPSVDVITGLIKANFPSRVAFRVTSKVDSRTIIDGNGADSLLGSGDMLFCDRGAVPVRLHGCYVDEEEIRRVVDFLKSQGKPIYNHDILVARDDDDGDDLGQESEGHDELYDKAVQIVAESRRVSVSYIQRRLSVGYNRAAKMVERMEREGVVSAPDHKKQREVLITAA